MYIIQLLIDLQLKLRDNSELSFITYVQVAIYPLHGVYYALTSQNTIKVYIGISQLPIKVSVYTRVLSKWLKATSPCQDLEVGAHRALYLLL